MLKRSLAVVPALALLPLLLAGCGSNDDTASGGASASTTPATSVPATSAPATSAAASETTTQAGTIDCTYTPDGTQATVDAPPSTPTKSGKVPATLHTTEGDVPLTLNADHAPCTVNSFVSLAGQKFFDNTPCHRLTTSGIYVLQCGDPTGTGSGGPGYSFNDETYTDDVYPAGTLAMANSGPNTNGSQFFLCYGDCTGLNPVGGQPASYTIFGTISKAGMAVLAKIAKAGEDDANGAGDGHPKDHVKITSVTIG